MDSDHRFALAFSAFQRADYAAVLDLLDTGEPRYAVDERVLALIVNAALQCGRNETAIGALERLVQLKPDTAKYRRMLSQALNRAGSAMRRAGNDGDAVTHYGRAIALWADNVDAAFNLASIYSQRQWHEHALPLWQRLHAATPSDTTVALELADCLSALGRIDQARAVLPATMAQTSADRLRQLEIVARVGPVERIATLLDAIEPTAADAPRLFALGDYLSGASSMDDARQAYRCAALTLDQGRQSPGLRGLIAAALALPAVYRDSADIDTQRQRYRANLASLDGQLSGPLIDASVKSLEQLAWTNFYLAYQGGNDRDLQSHYGRMLDRLAPIFAPPIATTPVARSRNPAKRRIAMVGSIFRRCTAGSYFGSWIGILAELGYEVDVVQLGPGFDDFTDELGQAAHDLHRAEPGLNALANRLRAADYDLLIYPELGMDARLFPLAALRLARRQACAWGHPVTTGLASIDAFFSCRDMEPDDAQDHYSETLCLLPGLGTDYLQPAPPAAASRAELGLPEARHLYLLPQSLFKMHPDNDAVMAMIAARDPRATLVMFRGEGGAAWAPYQRRIHGALRGAGADPDRQLVFLPMGSRERYLQVNRQCDVMVDSLHWSGGNTSLDALVSGLPIVTCPGRYMRSRQSAAMVRRMGLDELVVDSPAMLASVAIDIATDRDRQRSLGQRIEHSLPALFDTTGLANALRSHVEQLLARDRPHG